LNRCYFRPGSNAFVRVCVFVSQQNYAKILQAIFVKPRRIMNYSCRRNPYNLHRKYAP